ncbi:hypothetical protein SCLCIDRAFT_1219645 [Scleroderma citrinum Foug A]|uniref:Uncharacterized protein n=1 Tax=Scleroderma citrinum Foug A TaxID=1036808 RepID=A0A0C2Z5H6_9AGAM|nr:hypothetical protein SCLCIDRAFT_1219645 [Scleroderma citrinum Foug A]
MNHIRYPTHLPLPMRNPSPANTHQQNDATTPVPKHIPSSQQIHTSSETSRTLQDPIHPTTYTNTTSLNTS